MIVQRLIRTPHDGLAVLEAEISNYYPFTVDPIGRVRPARLNLRVTQAAIRQYAQWMPYREMIGAWRGLLFDPITELHHAIRGTIPTSVLPKTF